MYCECIQIDLIDVVPITNASTSVHTTLSSATVDELVSQSLAGAIEELKLQSRSLIPKLPTSPPPATEVQTTIEPAASQVETSVFTYRDAVSLPSTTELHGPLWFESRELFLRPLIQTRDRAQAECLVHPSSLEAQQSLNEARVALKREIVNAKTLYAAVVQEMPAVTEAVVESDAVKKSNINTLLNSEISVMETTDASLVINAAISTPVLGILNTHTKEFQVGIPTLLAVSAAMPVASGVVPDCVMTVSTAPLILQPSVTTAMGPTAGRTKMPKLLADMFNSVSTSVVPIPIVSTTLSLDRSPDQSRSALTKTVPFISPTAPAAMTPIIPQIISATLRPSASVITAGVSIQSVPT